MMTTFLIIRLITAVGLIGIICLINFLAAFFQEKRSHGVNVLRVNSEINPTASRAS